jgi:Site-specific recombinase XerD
MSLVREEMSETVDADPTRRDVTIPDMRAFVARVRHPLDRALVVTLLKTGLRVGELCNLDLRDCNIGPVEAFGVGPRVAIEDRQSSLYVDGSIDRGDRVNGEERTAANKRRRSTVVPVDDELERVLTRWLAVRPAPRSSAEPLFVSTREWGRRVTPAMVRRVVRDHARAVGWYREGAGSEENVTPHYFRHFFTTHLRDQTGDRGVVKYLRGDVASDIIDTYTHDWGSRVRDAYAGNIYSVLGSDARRPDDT